LTSVSGGLALQFGTGSVQNQSFDNFSLPTELE